MVSFLFAEEGDLGVTEAMKLLELSDSLLKFIKDKEEQWVTFGKMNSHLYRDQLMRRMKAKQLSKESATMVFFLASVIKSGPRIVKAMDQMTEEEKKLTWWFPTKDFFLTETTQYVSQAVKNQKFPVVNIPTCMPGLDVLFFCLMTPKERRTLDNLSLRPTFSQLDLQEAAQTKAKEGYSTYWTKIIKGTKNPDKPEAPGMKEDYYQNAAGDKYHLVKKDMTLIQPAVATGYTLAEIQTYLDTF